MKLLSILNKMVIKEDKQVWYICFLTKKTESRASVNEKPAQELNKPVIKRNLKRKICMRGLNIIFMQQIQLKWDHNLLRTKVLNIYNVRQMFSPNLLQSNFLEDKKAKAVLHGFTGRVNDPKRKLNKLCVD